MTGKISALDLAPAEFSEVTKACFAKCEEKLGRVPNVLQAYGDSAFGEMMVMNFRATDLSARQTVMREFAVKLTEEPAKIVEPDRAALRQASFSNRDIWDIASTAAFFNMSNRVAAAIDMRPNDEYHTMAR